MMSGLSWAAMALLFGYLALFFWGSAVAAQAASEPVWLFARDRGRYWLHAEVRSARGAPPATMDIVVIGAYLYGMIVRLVTILAILAITVVTSVASAHAARMSIASGPEHATHVGEMMHSPDVAQFACEGEQGCGPADAGMCEFVCAGLSAFLTSPGGESGHAYGPAGHDFPFEASHVGHSPGLNERPPKLRLL